MNVKNPNDIKVIIEKLIGEDNDKIASLKRDIKELEQTLTQKVTSLKDLQESLDEFQEKFTKIKTRTNELKKDIKPILDGNYDELFALLGLDVSFASIMTTENNVATETCKEYQEQITKLKAESKELKPEIAKIEEKLESLGAILKQEVELQTLLIANIKSSKEGTLDATKKEIIAFLKQFTDKDGKPLFEAEELSIAAQMVMFAENFNFETEKKKTMGEAIKEAKELAETEEKQIEQTLKTDEEEIELEEIDLDGVEESNEIIASSDEPQVVTIEKLPEAEKKDFNLEDLYQVEEYSTETTEKEETPIVEDAIEIDLDGVEEKVVDTEPVEEQKVAEEKSLDLEKNAEDIAYLEKNAENIAYLEENGVDPLDVNAVSSNFSKENITTFAENYNYLKSIGIEGNYRKSPVTLYTTPTKELLQRMEIARSFGYKVKTVQDIETACKIGSNIFDLAVEEFGDKYDERITYSGPILSLYLNNKSQEIEDTNAILTKKYGEIVTRLKDAIEDTENPAIPMAYTGLVEQIDSLAEGRTRFSFVIDGVYVSKHRIEENLKKLLSLNTDTANEDLMIIACLYNSTKTSEEIEKIISAFGPSFGGR